MYVYVEIKFNWIGMIYCYWVSYLFVILNKIFLLNVYKLIIKCVVYERYIKDYDVYYTNEDFIS